MIPSQMLKGVLQGSVLAILGQQGDLWLRNRAGPAWLWIWQRFRGDDLSPFAPTGEGGMGFRPVYGLGPGTAAEILYPYRPRPEGAGAVPGQFPGDDGGSGAAAGIWRGGDDMRKSSVRTLRQENNARERGAFPGKSAGDDRCGGLSPGAGPEPLGPRGDPPGHFGDGLGGGGPGGRPWPKWWGRTTGPLPGDCSCGAPPVPPGADGGGGGGASACAQRFAGHLAGEKRWWRLCCVERP